MKTRIRETVSTYGWTPYFLKKTFFFLKVEITYFPFDEQRCKLEFSTWMHDESEIDLQVKEFELIVLKIYNNIIRWLK